MRAKKRYALLIVFLVILAIDVFFTLVGIIVAQLSPEVKVAAGNAFTLNAIEKQVVGIIFQSLVFYFSLNRYNTLIVERRTAIHYIWYTTLLLAIMFGYYCGMHYLF